MQGLENAENGKLTQVILNLLLGTGLRCRLFVVVWKGMMRTDHRPKTIINEALLYTKFL